MVTITGAAPPFGAPRFSPVADRLRWALLAMWVLITLVALVVGAEPSSYASLRAGLDEGSVHSVTVSGGLPAGADGSATQTVRWRSGVLTHLTTVTQTRGQQSSTQESSGSDGSPSAVLHVDVASDITARHPHVQVVREHARSDTSTGDFLGWTVPWWVGLAVVVTGLVTLSLLVNGPQPWRATRWAWFWLFWVPFGPVAFLVLSGPTPPLRADPGERRRLGGRWAFVLALILGQVLRSHR